MQSKSQIQSMGMDLGKTTFHLVALGSRCQVVVRKKFSRQQRLSYTANLPSSLMGMEACVGPHFLGRALREQGHEVRLIPAQFVRPFVKNDANNCGVDGDDTAADVDADRLGIMLYPPQHCDGGQRNNLTFSTAVPA